MAQFLSAANTIKPSSLVTSSAIMSLLFVLSAECFRMGPIADSSEFSVTWPAAL